jgi:hypothetical protein
MTRVDRLLRLADLACGAHARATVFEPLVADWQRQLRDSRSQAARAWIAVSGGAAFARSLGRCANLSAMAQQMPRSSYGLILGVFSMLTVFHFLQPIQILWRRAMWQQPEFLFIWVDRPFTMLWYVPGALAAGVGFAILPATLLAFSAGWRLRRVVSAAMLACVAVVVLDGWVQPTFGRFQHDRWLAGLNRPAPQPGVRNATQLQLIVLAAGRNPEIAADARARLTAQASQVLTAISLAALGAAIGRARRASGRTVRLRALAGWWLLAWTAFALLRYWSNYPTTFPPVNRVLVTWSAPVVFFGLATLAWVCVSRNGRDVAARGQ